MSNTGSPEPLVFIYSYLFKDDCEFEMPGTEESDTIEQPETPEEGVVTVSNEKNEESDTIGQPETPEEGIVTVSNEKNVS